MPRHDRAEPDAKHCERSDINRFRKSLLQIPP
jgi:hypothetical protein